MKSYVAAWHYARFVRAQFRDLLRSFRLDARQAVVLQALYDTEGITQDELATVTGLHRAVISKALAGLAIKGYVYRKPAKKSKRSTFYPTVTARKLEAEFRKRVAYAEQMVQADVFDFFPIREAAKAS
jgi:DNA-binding MarR family transcriptional regulator